VKPLIVEEAAELELIGSVAFYEERKTGLGLDFAAAARQAAVFGFLLPNSYFLLF